MGSEISKIHALRSQNTEFTPLSSAPSGFKLLVSNWSSFWSRGYMEPMPNISVLSPWEPGILALGVFSLMAALLVITLLFIAGWLGERKPNLEKLRPYECGIIPTGTARFRYPIAFYLIAAFFLIFDVEAAYIFSWAIAFDRLGWSGWLQISFFIAILLISLFYIWKKGGLEWGPSVQKGPATPETSSSPSSTP
jgi:NADH-quinone oxidoreductase subunit A